jgi:hypothetical protein
MWRNANSITIHLVNLTNPMTMKGPYRDFFPIGTQTLKLRLSTEVHASRARLLVANRDVKMEKAGDRWAITVPSILDHEVVAIEI